MGFNSLGIYFCDDLFANLKCVFFRVFLRQVYSYLKWHVFSSVQFFPWDFFRIEKKVGFFPFFMGVLFLSKMKCVFFRGVFFVRVYFLPKMNYNFFLPWRLFLFSLAFFWSVYILSKKGGFFSHEIFLVDLFFVGVWIPSKMKCFFFRGFFSGGGLIPWGSVLFILNRVRFFRVFFPWGLIPFSMGFNSFFHGGLI